MASGDNKLQKRVPTSIKERGQYFLAFGVIASMLLVAGFPVFVVFFFGVFAYFLWKIFSSGTRSDSREIFEFYLAANEILRDDDRRWYGFEVNEVLRRGETLLQTMNGAPPLVYFTLGALYNKIGDHKSAVHHLSYVIENESSNEATYLHPSPELRNYVRILRKIEREPAETPLTSGAVRALERARKNRGLTLLEDSRVKLRDENRKKRETVDANHLIASSTEEPNSVAKSEASERKQPESVVSVSKSNGSNDRRADSVQDKERRKNQGSDPFVNRKPISEVLHDIYDKNVQ